METAFFIVFRCDAFAVIPSFFAFAERGFSKVKHGGKVAVVTDEIRDFLFFFVEYFPNGKRVVGEERTVAHFTQEFAYASGIFQHVVNKAQAVCAVNRVIFIWKLFLDIDDGINTEAPKTFVQPPVDIFVNFLPYSFVFPVEIRLFFVEQVHILLVRTAGKGFPYGAAEITSPVAGQFSFFSILYVEEIAVLPVRVSAGFLEPLMFVGTVVYHQVHKNIHAAFFCFFQQKVHIFHGAEGRVYLIVI